MNMGLNVRLRFLSSSSLLHSSPAFCFFCRSLSSFQYTQVEKNRAKCSIPQGAHNKKGSKLLHFMRLCENIKELKQITSLFVVHGGLGEEPHVFELLRLCFYSGTPELALDVFQSTKSPSLFLLNFMIKGLSDYALYDDLLRLYKKFSESGCSSDNFTYPLVIKACASIRALRSGKEVHCVVLKTQFEQNLGVQTSLVDMYAKNGKMEISSKLFYRIPHPDMVSWNALLSGYSFNCLDHEAFKVFQQFLMMDFRPSISTIVSLVHVCSNLGCLDVGRSVQSLAIKCGFSSNESLVTALISMYSYGEEECVAGEMLDLLHGKNVIAWNAMISACAQDRKSQEAFEVYRKMLQESVQPNLVTFVSIIPSCDNLEYGCGYTIHASAIKLGLAHQPAVVTALLSMYAKLGDLHTAQFLFDKMPEKSLLSWNSMVSGYVQNGLLVESLTAFREMLSVGISPDSVSMINVISACNKLKDTKTGMSAHAYGLRSEINFNLNLSNTLLTFYCDCSKLSSAIKLFDMMIIRNVVSWNTLISGCIHRGNMSTAINLLHQMQHENMRFDLVTLISILPCFFEIKKLKEGMSVHGYAIKTGFSSDISVTNALISMYVNCGNLSDGHLLFEEMPVRSVVSWNALLSGYRYNDNLNREIMILFHQMIMEYQRPNYVTLLNVLPGCCSHMQVKSIHAYAIRSSDILQTPLLTSLICLYAEFENVNICRLLFERSDKSNITLWNALMSAHVRSKNAKYVVSELRKMLLMGPEPDHVTILTLISACVQLNSFSLIQSVMGYIICKGFERDLLVSNALVDMYNRCGYESIARKIFDGLNQKDIVSWSVMINGYAIHGDGEAALELFSLMKVSGLEPDDVTFISILSACSHSGLVEEGRFLFNSMTTEYGIIPRMEHYACMVDLLGRTGHLIEAYELIKGLPFKPSESLLESLLGACSIHGNFVLAEEIGELLVDLEPKNSGSYVMLSNVYAAAGRWGKAGKVRSNMDERQVRKVPGFSLIEVDGYN